MRFFHTGLTILKFANFLQILEKLKFSFLKFLKIFENVLNPSVGKIATEPNQLSSNDETVYPMLLGNMDDKVFGPYCNITFLFLGLAFHLMSISVKFLAEYEQLMSFN